MDAGREESARPHDREGRVRAQPRLDSRRPLLLVRARRTASAPGSRPWSSGCYHREGGGAGIKLTSGDDLNNAGGAVVSQRRPVRSTSPRAPAQVQLHPRHLSDGLWQIWRYDRDLAETFPVAGGFGGAARPALSPDGKTLTFVSRRDDDTCLVARDLAIGKPSAILARGVTRDEMEGFAQMDLWPGYAFTPDGKSLVFSNHGKLARLEVATGALGDIPFTAAGRAVRRAPRRLAGEDETGPVRARSCAGRASRPTAAGSPSRRSAGSGCRRSSGGKGGRCAAPPDARRRGPAEARVRADFLRPMASWIAYVSWSDAEGGHVWKAPAAPGARRCGSTKSPGHYANPAWSPGGDRLALLQGLGARVPRPTAGRRRVLRDRPPRSGERRPRAGDDRQARAGAQVPPPGLLERRRHAPLLPQPRRAEEAHRRPEERSRRGSARRHGRADAAPLSCGRRHRPVPRREPGSPSPRATTST